MAKVKHIGPQSPEWYEAAREAARQDEAAREAARQDEAAREAARQDAESRTVHVVAEIDRSEPPTWSQGPDYSVNHEAG